MINFHLGEPNKSADQIELPINVELNATNAPTNIVFTFTLTNPVTQVTVTYRYEDPALLRVVEGGQTFQIEG